MCNGRDMDFVDGSIIASAFINKGLFSEAKPCLPGWSRCVDPDRPGDGTT